MASRNKSEEHHTPLKYFLISKKFNSFIDNLSRILYFSYWTKFESCSESTIRQMR